MIFNMGTAAPTFELIAYGYPSATVTVTDGKKTWTQVTGSDGRTVFLKLKKGMYTVTATAGNESKSYEVTIGKDSSNMLSINAIPEFTFTGSYKIVNDSDVEISHAIKNWKVRFLTGGTVTLKKLNGAADGIDVFCVGGGGNGGHGSGQKEGGGGGGGHTKTARGVSITTTTYPITIGGSGGNTSAFGIEAPCGKNGRAQTPYAENSGATGGDGGSGGGAMRVNGGTDGGAGSSWASGGAAGTYTGGSGQGYTTREFGEPNGTVYAGGGGGGAGSQGFGGAGGAGGGGAGAVAGYQTVVYGGNGVPNTGGGGGGCGYSSNDTSLPGSGGSGIVIIRNKRR